MSRSTSLVRLVLVVSFLFGSVSAHAVSTTVVVSQFQVAGGTSADEFVELHNVSNAAIDINGWRLVYRSAAGTTDLTITTWSTSTIIPAGGYYLVAHSADYDGATTADQTFNLGATGSFAAGGGGLALRIGAAGTGTLVDSVGYGTATNAFVEGTVETAPGANTSAARQTNGCQDTDNNATDFVNVNPSAPRNSSTSAVICGGPVLPNLTINDVSLNEGNAGTTTFTFTVSLSAPAGAGGVTFNIATADGTAVAPGDYTAKSLTGQTIPAGSSTYAFSVLVNGDTTPETNETFFANVTSVTGANVTDGQGQGTIVNDDAAPNLTINDVTLAEGNAGTTTFTFTVSLSAPAPAGGVTFDIATADNTAVAPGDYTAKSLTGQTIAAGSSTYTFDVLINGDTTPEGSETFFVNVTNITNAIGTDPQGLGTITNDDFTPIHDIQGNGNSSPLVGTSVVTRGIVTGVKSNGFFIQEPDASVDADPATSEGVFVFTSSAPPAAATLGNLVQVTATVVEFVPTQDPLQPPLTELSSPTVVQLSTGNPLPAAIPLTATFPDPAGAFDQLERLEGMRVSVASLTVVAPTDGNVSEANATSTSTGDFYGVVTGVARPFREPGIQAPDPAPSGGGTIPPIPRWDTNPETLRVDNGLVGSPVLDVSTSAVVTGLVGPLDYGFRRYTILPEPAPTPVPIVTGGKTATSVTAATAREFTVAGYNLERFFDTTNDPAIGEPVLTATAFNNRLNKASLGIRNHLGTPDIVAIIEIENLTTLQAVAARISSDAVAASQPDPLYQAYLVEGNDVGGIDVGFLVKTSIVAGSTPRVTVNSVTQELDGSLFVNADTSTETLHDRPPLRLDAVIHHPNGATFPIQVIAVHNRSLNSVNDESAGSNGWPTAGARVRAKRQKQAEDLATLIQTRQTNNPAERIVILGDYNAFEFNDGYVDAMNVITGTPVPDNETAVAGDGVDLMNPNLDNLFDTAPGPDRYSYLFDGQAQSLDHVVVNQALINGTLSRRLEHPRINADFPEVDRNDATTARRLADHDPVVSFYEVSAFATADVSITKTDNVDPVNAGQNFFYTVTVTNAGPDPADNVSWSDALPAGTTFVSLSQPGGWTCTTPAVGANGTVSCSIASLGVASAAFNVTVAVNAGLASGTVLSNTATVTSTTGDPDNTDLSATETTTVATSADLAITKADSPDPVNAGSNLSYQITLTNNGPSNAANASFSDTLPAGTTFVSLSTTGTWSCTPPSVGGTGTVTCTNASFPVTADFFTLVVKVSQNVAAGTVLSNTATISSTTTDSNSANNSATATTTVATAADMQITKVDTPDPVTAGTNLTYTIGINNAGPSDASGATFTDTIPANTTFVSLATFADFSCTNPAVGGTGTITCTKPSNFLANSSGNFTLVVNVNSGTATGTVITNTAGITTATAETNAANNNATATTTVGAGSADLSITKTDSPDPVTAGMNITYTITVTNAGPTNATSASWTDTLPAGATFVSLSQPGGWSCATPAVGTNGTLTCSIATLGVTSAPFTLVVNVDPAFVSGTTIDNTVTVTAATTDPNGANNGDSETTLVNASADLQVTKVDSPDPVTAGTGILYTITVTNAGPSTATNVTLNDTLPAGTTFASFVPAAGWTCPVPPGIPSITAIVCTNPSLAPGASSTFTLGVTVDPATPNGTVITNSATVASATADPNSSNNTGTTTTTVGAGSADISIIKVDTPDPVSAGANITYTITVSNAGPTNAASASLTDTLPAGTTFVSLASPAGWTCTTPAAGAAGTVTCTNPSLGTGNAVFSLVVRVAPATASGTVITNTATVSSTTADPNTGNETASATTNVVSPATVSGTKTVTGTFVPGGSVTYTIVLTNNGTSAQQDNAGNEFVDVLPAQLVLSSATATSGTAVATTATNTVTWNGSIAAGASVTITINATIRSNAAAGTVVSNQGTIHYDADGNGTNESTRPTDSPAGAGASDPTTFSVAALAFEAIPTLDEYALMALAVLLAAAAALVLKK